ncbi:MAG: dTDP-4-dehydrorhamnose 3,5-epimerase [Hyphomicrobiales bacterium]
MSGDIVLIHPRRFGDDRGWFTESYNKQKFLPLGIGYDFVQDNHSLSVPAGTLRGLHFQTPPFAQAKLVRCVRGKIFDVAVDIRNNSPTYGNWVGAELSAENGHQLLVPEGFAHGFVTLQDNTEVLYKVSNYYAPDNDAGLMWNDNDIGIDWPLAPGTEPVLSGKDTKHPSLADFQSPFEYDGTPMNLVEIEP